MSKIRVPTAGNNPDSASPSHREPTAGGSCARRCPSCASPLYCGDLFLAARTARSRGDSAPATVLDATLSLDMVTRLSCRGYGNKIYNCAGDHKGKLLALVPKPICPATGNFTKTLVRRRSELTGSLTLSLTAEIPPRCIRGARLPRIFPSEWELCETFGARTLPPGLAAGGPPSY
jgi:hypothetical protein